MRRISTLFAAVLMALAVMPVAGAGQFPEEIALPDGIAPEGIAVGQGSSFYVGSLANGAIYKGDLRTGAGSFLTAPLGVPTVGIEVDNRERIWAAGGPSGQGRLYDGTTGALLATYQFTPPGVSFVNDVVVTADAAYFTDSYSPQLFVVPLSRSGEPAGGFAVLPVAVPDIAFPNLNGIETTTDGRALIVGHTTAATLYRVDPADGSAVAIDVGTAVPNNDGLIRRGTTLYVVQNFLRQISAVALTPDGVSGVVSDVYGVEGSLTPTTAGLFGGALYAVDARFGASTATGYNVYRIPLN